jgi:hypothetical protein
VVEENWFDVGVPIQDADKLRAAITPITDDAY